MYHNVTSNFGSRFEETMPRRSTAAERIIITYNIPTYRFDSHSDTLRPATANSRNSFQLAPYRNIFYSTLITCTTIPYYNNVIQTVVKEY